MIFIDQDKEISRADAVRIVTERDGDYCFICKKPFGSCGAKTLDHWISIHWARNNGWTYDRINNVDNLRVAGQKCNAKKSHYLPNEDGTITFPPRRPRLVERRAVRKDRRVSLCETCMSGRLLLEGETCEVCHSGPQPSTFPAYASMRSDECPHSGIYSCFACIVGIVDRVPAWQYVLNADDDSEFDE